MRDIHPGLDGSPRGYIVAIVAKLPNGDQAVIKWSVRATFDPGPDGKPRLLDNSLWHFIGATGSLEAIKGAGSMHIKPSPRKTASSRLRGRRWSSRSSAG